MKKRITAGLLLGFVQVSACTNVVDCGGMLAYNPDSFSTKQQEWIATAAARWNDWVGYQVLTVYPDSNKRSSCYIDAGKAASEKAVGWCIMETKEIAIDLEKMRTKYDGLDKKPAGFQAVVMHEMGHALGFNHINAPAGALMNPTCELDFTAADRAECIRIGVCVSDVRAYDRVNAAEGMLVCEPAMESTKVE